MGLYRGAYPSPSRNEYPLPTPNPTPLRPHPSPPLRDRYLDPGLIDNTHFNAELEYDMLLPVCH